MSYSSLFLLHYFQPENEEDEQKTSEQNKKEENKIENKIVTLSVVFCVSRTVYDNSQAGT